MTEHVRVDIADQLAVVTIARPTMAPAFFAQLGDAFRSIRDRDDVRVAIIESEVKCFSYGLDLPATMAEHGALFAGGLAQPRSKLHRLIRELQAHVTAIVDCPVPVIAAIHGWCVGGGLDVAAACDIRLASIDAKFSLRETRVAIVADLGSLQRLPAIIGQGHTRELAFTGKDIDAARAEAIGLINHIYPDRDSLARGARELAAEISACAPLTVQGVKEVLNFCQDKSTAEGLDYVAAWNSAFLASEDLGEAAAAFASKRAPKFQGK